MDPRLTNLLELQEAMKRQKEIEKQYQEIPQRKDEIQTTLQKLEQDIQATEERIKRQEVEYKTTELELKQGQETRVKKEAQVFALKSAKEYQATQSEIENLDRKNTRLEEKLIQLIDATEEAKKALLQKREELQEKKNEFADELAALEGQEQSLSSRVEEVRAATQAVAANLGPDLFRRFERVFHGKGGIAIAAANSGYCGACNIRLTPRLLQVTKRGQDIVTCEGCSRFLYWDHSLEEDEFSAL